jgi:DNA-binding response OmpR family regulator
MKATHLVLVVDDDMDIRCTIAQILREEGFRVREARNGREALAKIADEEPDLVLLDLMMPAVNGWEVLEALRLSQSDVPVVILSALPAQGRDDYIEKPVTFARLFQLLETIRARVKPPAIHG